LDYVYQFKDHLQNLRLSYSDRNKDGAITQDEIIQEKNYYPFGMTHSGYNNTLRGRNHNYGFGNKEEQDELGLDWIDITARNYDPSLGRWMNIDPLAEEMRRFSPYTYAFNNPIYFIDPDGMMPIGIGGMDEIDNFDKFNKFNTGITGGSPFDNRHNDKDFDPSQINLINRDWDNVFKGEADNGNNSTDSNENTDDCCGGNVTGTALSNGGTLAMGANGVEVIGGNQGETSESDNSSTGLTWRTPAGIGAILSGTKFTFLKPVGALGSSRGSTLLSYSLGKTFRGNIFKTFGRNRLTNKLVKKTGTAVIGRIGGRILSRFVPGLGWGLTIYDGGKFLYDDRQHAIQTKYGGDAKAYTKDLRNLMRATNNGICFIAGTKITMSDGVLKNIEDVRVGDIVKTYNFELEKVENNEVLKTISPVQDKLIKISLQNSIVNINTVDHPYFVKGKGWCSYKPIDTKKRYNFDVKQLEKNDTCYLLNGGDEIVEIKIINIESTNREERTYNLSEVKNNHNFFANGILVHNKQK
jgi:RHS repeat-associated protein